MSSTNIHNNNTVSDKSSDVKTFKPHFYDKNYAFINLDPRIIEALHLTPNDSMSEELTNDGSIILRKVSKS